MAEKEELTFVKEKVKKYSKENIIFTKTKLVGWLCQRNNATVDEMKEELLHPVHLEFAQKQVITYRNTGEERFRCYFVYSQNRGRCYILAFNRYIKIITVFPLGRTTLKRYRKRFK